jgi:iron complex transport system ATP-binding protein
MLRLKNISFSYQDQAMIQDMNAEIRQKTFQALIGPNGSGKTTLLRLMSRVLEPQRGRILLDGEPLGRMRASDIARKIAVISSEQYFEFPFLVSDVVAMGRYPHLARLQALSQKDLELVEDALRMTDLGPLRNRPISHLSSGERQRVFIARAIAQQPRVLMLDEPNAHLDVHHQKAVFDLLRTLHRDHGMTVIAVLHDLTTAAAFCEVVMLLHEGCVVRVGSPAEVITRDSIRETYGVEVEIFPSPVGGFPLVVFGPRA